MSKREDLTGKKFNKLLVLSRDIMVGNHQSWKCLCECGNIKVARGSHIKTGNIQSCGCLKSRANLIGNIYGKLTVINYADDAVSGQPRWLCRCECGKETIVQRVNLKNGHTQSCGCLTIGETSKIWKGQGGISGHKWSGIRRTANSRNIPFKITIEEAWNLFENQNGKCSLTNRELILENSRRYHADGINTASLDRIDSEFGYELNNVWWVHKDINIIKLELSIEKLLTWCYLIINKKESLEEFEYTCQPNHYNWSGYGLVSGYYISKIRQGAKSRKLEFDINAKSIWELYLEQKGCCGLTGIPISIIPEQNSKIRQTASLDRIDSSKGYTIDNVWWIHKQLNWMKWDFSKEYFLSTIKEIYDFNKDKYEFSKNI